MPTSMLPDFEGSEISQLGVDREGVLENMPRSWTLMLMCRLTEKQLREDNAYACVDSVTWRSWKVCHAKTWSFPAILRNIARAAALPKQSRQRLLFFGPVIAKHMLFQAKYQGNRSLCDISSEDHPSNGRGEVTGET